MTTELTTAFSFSWDSSISVEQNIQNWINFIKIFNLNQYDQVQYICEKNGVASHDIYTVEELTNEFAGLKIENEYATETCCVIEEQQSMDGVAIMTYKEIKRSGIQNPILFTGTFEECNKWRSPYTWDNPYCSE